MDIPKLKAELAAGHPDTGAYSADDEVATAQLNEPNRKRPRSSLSGNQMFTATDPANFAALTDLKRALWISWCNTDRNPYNAANVAFVQYIFGAGSQTITNLAAIRGETVGRAVELGLGLVYPGHIQNARM